MKALVLIPAALLADDVVTEPRPAPVTDARATAAISGAREPSTPPPDSAHEEPRP
ncbi:hypothetical protein [Nocardia barduliensis]|uniref:hypothetical protein n=1 Tax=Nocardia barduliensis TaxID=2736643 RepID=UPI0028B1DBA4|nr:hypothetical protein [Nocardia barduliensis]